MPDGTSSQIERRSFLQATGAAGAAAALGVTNVTAGRQQSVEESKREVLLSVPGSVPFERAVERAEERFEGTVTHTNEDVRYIALQRPELNTQAVGTMETEVASAPEFKSIESNSRYHAHAVSNDPRLGEQYAPQQTNAVDVWEGGFLGSEDVSIAIIDTGADYQHETLESRYGSNVGRDFAGRDSDPLPPSRERHGTHVSGIASATTDNGTGVAGQSNSQLYTIRALGGRSGSLSDIADGIQWAANQGVDIINMSLGGGGPSDVLKNAVSNAWSAGVTIFASAGNSGSRGVSYPSAFEECISVSAVDNNENLASFSQYGSKVEITAPGVDVLSTVPGDSYARFSGTSMSCPAAAGVAALGAAAAGDTSNSELRAAIKETARDIGLSSDEQGAGHVDAKALVDRLGDGGGGGGDDPEEPPEDPEEPPEDPGCGSNKNTGSAEGNLWFFNPSDNYSYSTQTSSPCQIEFSLDGPDNANFDLVVSSNGDQRRPDTPDADEQVIFQDVQPGQSFDITIESVGGSGSYTISVEEIGS